MSLTTKILQGAQGTISDQINAGVIHTYWSRSRVAWGKEVTLGALISGFPEGTKVKLLIYEADGVAGEDDFVGEEEATIEKGLAIATHRIEFEDPDSDEGDEYELYFLVEVSGEVLSEKETCPYLLVDMTLPVFSE